jgi:hypothetical protein
MITISGGFLAIFLGMDAIRNIIQNGFENSKKRRAGTKPDNKKPSGLTTQDSERAEH